MTILRITIPLPGPLQCLISLLWAFKKCIFTSSSEKFKSTHSHCDLVSINRSLHVKLNKKVLAGWSRTICSQHIEKSQFPITSPHLGRPLYIHKVTQLFMKHTPSRYCLTLWRLVRISSDILICEKLPAATRYEERYAHVLTYFFVSVLIRLSPFHENLKSRVETHLFLRKLIPPK